MIDEIKAPEKEHLFTVLFRGSMWWRIGYGSLRLLLGAMLLRVVGIPFSEVFRNIMSHELLQDPTDVLFQFVYHLLEVHTLTVTYFVAFYLIFWGTIDIFLSLCLLRHKLWAFPVSLGLIMLFVLYSVYRVLHTHSPILLGVILIDLCIMYLMHHEYRVQKRKMGQ
jgi:uncharacterized membrane protein